MECIHPYVMNGCEYPCGKCRACRVNHTREWALRLMHEREYWDLASFVTLTYDDENLPFDKGLQKRDVQGFLKRLRKDLGDRKIKYYAAGEYGDNTKRPHYHLIMFGIGYDDDELIKDNWKKGYIYIGYVTYKSCRYVAEYCQKKLGGDMAKKEYGNKEPPFQLVSKGIGLKWLEENANKIKNELVVKNGGKTFAVPRYYRKKLEIDASLYDNYVINRLNDEDDWFRARQIMSETERKAYKKARKEQKDEELKSIDERKNKSL